jgi:sortase A
MGTRSPIRLELDDRGLAPGRRAAPSRRRTLQWAERLLLLVGVLCVGYFLYTYAEERLYQAFEDRELDKILNDTAATGTSGTAREEAAPAPRTVPRRTFAAGSTVGRIEIPRLGVSAVIRAGSDARTLRLAVGYIPGTALPGDRGNFGLAGHRDTFFRKLRDINPDDEIRIVTKDGVFNYYVQRTSIVMPKDVWVLDPTNYPALTLVTCYPFNYIGSAPKRFIVRAALRTTREPARSNVSKPADPIASVRTKSSVPRAGVATKNASVRSTGSKSPRATAKLQTKRATVRTKATTPLTKAKQLRTAGKLRATD